VHGCSVCELCLSCSTSIYNGYVVESNLRSSLCLILGLSNINNASDTESIQGKNKHESKYKMKQKQAINPQVETRKLYPIDAQIIYMNPEGPVPPKRKISIFDDFFIFFFFLVSGGTQSHGYGKKEEQRCTSFFFFFYQVTT
jgi:hypothetical protein